MNYKYSLRSQSVHLFFHQNAMIINNYIIVENYVFVPFPITIWPQVYMLKVLF